MRVLGPLVSLVELGLGLVLACGLACGGPSPERPPPERRVEPNTMPMPAKPKGSRPAQVFAPVPAPAPTPVVFDAASVTTLRAKIIAIPNRESWVPCGYVHSIGALEVEVLDVGEPPPAMILLISCPVDLGLGRGLQGQRLEVGATIVVSLHAKDRPWPRVGRLAKELPRRQVAAFLSAPL